MIFILYMIFPLESILHKPNLKRKTEILKTQAEGDPVEWDHLSWNSISYKIYKSLLISQWY